MAPPEGIDYDLTDCAPLEPSRKRQRRVGSEGGCSPSEGADKGAVECAAQVDVNAGAIGEALDSEDDRPLADLRCHSARDLSTPLQPVPRGENEEVGESGRIFTALRTRGIVTGYSLKCKWHEEDDWVLDLSLGTRNPMTVQECQLRLLRWEEEGQDLRRPGAREHHRLFGGTKLLANFAS